MKSNSCDCVFLPWVDLKLMKIARDDPNPVLRITEMFANYQIEQRKVKEARNELEFVKKQLVDAQTTLIEKNKNFAELEAKYARLNQENAVNFSIFILEFYKRKNLRVSNLGHKILEIISFIR